MNERFDLDALDLSDLIEDVDNLDMDLEDDLNVNNFKDLEQIDEPHIRVSTKDFKDFIRLAKYVISNNAKDIVSKSVIMEHKDGKIVGYTTDHDVYLEFNMDMIDTENILDEPICFPLDSIIKMLKALPSTTAILKDDEGFKVKLPGGALPLETHNLDVEKFKYKDEVKESAVPVMNAKQFNVILRDLGAIAQNAIAANERRIVFDETGAYANYMFSMTKVPGAFPKMDIKIKDLVILKNLTASLDESLMFYDIADETKSKRKVIKSNKFTYAFLISEQGINSTLIKMEQDLECKEGLFIDFMQMYKLVELSNDLGYSLGKLGLNFTDENKLEVAFKTKKGKDSMFYIDGTTEMQVDVLKKALEVPAKFLKILLMSFVKESTINISLMDKAIVVNSENYKGVLFLAN